MDRTSITRVLLTTLVRWLPVPFFHFTVEGKIADGMRAHSLLGTADPGGRPVAIALDTVCPVSLLGPYSRTIALTGLYGITA